MTVDIKSESLSMCEGRRWRSSVMAVTEGRLWLAESRCEEGPEDRRDAAGDLAGVAGPSWPWSSMCSRAASSCLGLSSLRVIWLNPTTAHLHILHRIRRRGPPPGVLGAESEGVWGNFASMSVSDREPSPPGIK